MGVSIDVWRARIGSSNHNGQQCSCPRLNSYLKSFVQHAGLAAMLLVLINILLVIGCVEIDPGPVSIDCAFCNRSYSSASGWATHQESHASNRNFSFECFVCHESCASAKAFNVHYSRFHSKEKSKPPPTKVNTVSDVLQGVTYTCTVPTCLQNLRTAGLLRRHSVQHLRRGYVVQCPFQPCLKKFTTVSTFQTHVSRNHCFEEEDEERVGYMDNGGADNVLIVSGNEDGQIMFRDDDEEEDEDSEEENHRFEDSEHSDSDCCSDTSNSDCEEDSNESREDIYPENLVRNFVGKFYLMLEGDMLLSKPIVQRISEEIARMCRMSHHRIKTALRNELCKAEISNEKSEEIITNSLKKDIIFNTHHKKGDVLDVTTDHMRQKFYKHKCFSLLPEDIFLGHDDNGKKRYEHHVSIADSLQALFSDPSVQNHIDASFKRKPKKNVFQDFVDGSTFTQHPICGNMDSIQIILFQDAFEFYPLSPTSGLYKCVGFYFTLGNIHPDSRSKVDAIQLSLLVKESDLKFFTPEKCLERLIKELEHLTKNGIKYKGRTLPVVVMHMCGDNLGQNFIGRYIQCFTSDYSCRFCEVKNSDILKHPYVTLPLRTPDSYDQAAAQVNPENPLDSHKGVKGSSVLNSIPFFHVCNPAQPPCVAHDILEGVARNDYALFLRYFVQIKGWTSVEQLNRRIANFKLKGRDAADSMMKLDPALKKIRGHASEVWLFVRMLPFLMGDRIEDVTDPVWKLCLLLKSICEYVFAPSISTGQVVKLRELINLYVETRAKLFYKKIQPKHHYLCHYADLIVLFGPLIRLWTMRFESRHVFFKRAAKVANNFKNITKTLAKKYLLNFAYKLTSPLFTHVSYCCALSQRAHRAP